MLSQQAAQPGNGLRVPAPASRNQRKPPGSPRVRVIHPPGGSTVEETRAPPPPLAGRVQIPQPSIVHPQHLLAHVAAALGVSRDSIHVVSANAGAYTLDFAVHNAHHIYRDDAEMALHLSTDVRLRTDLGRAVRVHCGEAFTIVCSLAMSDRTWSALESSGVFEVIEQGLCASAGAPQQSASVVLEAFAEAISPQTVHALRRELEAATATAADLRIEVGHLNRQSDCSTLEQQLKAAVEDRRAAERKYQDAVSREAATKAELNAVEGQARRAVPEIQQLRTELRRLQEENLRLEKQRSDRQNELDAVRTDTTESLDRLSRELADADREVAAWKKRCTDLERERDAMQRSYRTAEEALQLSLHRTERQLFEARAAQSSAVSSKPRSLSPDGDDTIELQTRLQRVEAHLRERTLQLAAALKTRAT
jgi:hypothetical protein